MSASQDVYNLSVRGATFCVGAELAGCPLRGRSRKGTASSPTTAATHQHITGS
jgi:hypothetical protein